MSVRLIAILACLVSAACSAITPAAGHRAAAARRVRHHSTTMWLRPICILGVRRARAHRATIRSTPPGPAPPSTILAGELSSNPRWTMMSPLTKQEMLQARVDVRQVLGIAPNAPSQIVVERAAAVCCRLAGRRSAGSHAGACGAGLHSAAAADGAGAEQPALHPDSPTSPSLDAANQMLPGGGNGRF